MTGKKKVLFIDDESTTESTIRRLTIVHKLHVDWAKSPSEGLRLLKKNKYSTVILDIMMPIDDDTLKHSEVLNEYGLETGIILLKLIMKDSELFNSLRVVFCSAREDNIALKHGLEEGVQYEKYFRKPYNTEELYNILKKS